MPPARPSATPAPGPSSSRNFVADALYNWARTAKAIGEIFLQHELINSGTLEKPTLEHLLPATQNLVNRRLFKLHDLKGATGVGWEVIEEQVAANYEGLTSDEQMVYASIESSGTQGIWTKTIKAKSGVHAKVLDRVYKSLEGRMLIKPMKSVKFPQRKMYILYHLQPSEEATGGTWFNDGRLDIGMIEAVSDAIEAYCSIQSWQQVQEVDPLTGKRKEPEDGHDETGPNKARKLESGNRQEQKQKKIPTYEPFEPGYKAYPTLADLSTELKEKRIVAQAIPINALKQLLDVMVFDNRLFAMMRDARGDEFPDEPDKNQISMYRCFTNPWELGQKRQRKAKIEQHGSSSARRAQEIEELGIGGFSEVPCLDCPVFEICGDGGPINPKTCEYLPPWQEKMEMADREIGDIWPALPKGIRPRKVVGVQR